MNDSRIQEVNELTGSGFAMCLFCGCILLTCFGEHLCPPPTGYPTLILLPAGPKSVSSGVPYSGQRDLDALMKFATNFAGDSVKANQLLSNQQVTRCFLLQEI